MDGIFKMKKLFLVLFLCVLILGMVSSAKFDMKWWENEFESNPDKTWEKFENNPDLWSDETAREIAFKTDPVKAATMINEEISKKYVSLQTITLNQESLWIESSNLTELLDEAIKENLDILNKNIYLKREWFSQKGIFDEGAEIEFYNGEIIKTKGEESTTFNITDEIFSGSKIMPSGKLILKDGTEISSSEISRTETGELIFKGGQIDLSSLSEIEFSILEGGVKIGEKIYSNNFNETFYVSSKDGFVTFKGKEMTEKSHSGDILSKFTGTLKTNGYKVLGESTKYALFFNGRESRSYNVDKETEFHAIQGGCTNSLISCIEEFDLEDYLNEELNKSRGYKNIKIIPKNNNLIEIKTSDNFINNLNIDQIKDNSSVIFNDKDQVILEFTKDPIRIKGNFAKLSSNINSFFENNKGEIHEINIENGIITQCSFPCESFSLTSVINPRLKELLYSPEGKKYEKEIQEKYGDQAKLWYLNYLVVGDNPKIYKAVVAASQGLYERKGKYISPEFIYVGAVAEGLGSFIEHEKLNWPVNGFFYLGLDSFGDNAEILRKNGYLPKDFNEGKGYWEYTDEGYKAEYIIKEGKYATDINYGETGTKVLSGNFGNLEDAFVAKAAEYAWRQDIFLNDIKEMGIKENEMSQDAINFWTYFYYNAGKATGKDMLQSYKTKGYLINDNYIWKRPNKFYTYPHLFANRRMANLKLVENSGVVFPRT